MRHVSFAVKGEEMKAARRKGHKRHIKGFIPQVVIDGHNPLGTNDKRKPRNAARRTPPICSCGRLRPERNPTNYRKAMLAFSLGKSDVMPGRYHHHCDICAAWLNEQKRNMEEKAASHLGP